MGVGRTQHCTVAKHRPPGWRGYKLLRPQWKCGLRGIEEDCQNWCVWGERSGDRVNPLRFKVPSRYAFKGWSGKKGSEAVGEKRSKRFNNWVQGPLFCVLRKRRNGNHFGNRPHSHLPCTGDEVRRSGKSLIWTLVPINPQQAPVPKAILTFYRSQNLCRPRPFTP